VNEVDNIVADESTNDVGVETTQPVLEPFEDTNQEGGMYMAEEKVETPVAPQENPEEKRHEYWQSKYDQKASEYSKMEEKLKEFQQLEPIARHINDNPWVLDNVAKSLSGDTPQVPSQEKSVESLKKPERPSKPSNYDASEAYMDPESASFKYRENLDNYREELVSYQEDLEAKRQSDLERQYQQQQAQQQEQMARQQQEAMQQNLINSYGYTPEKASEFINYYTSPDSLSLENLVALDRIRNAPSTAEVQTRQKAEMMKNRQGRAVVPPPAGVGSGEPEPQYNDEDLFNLGLMANKRT